MLGLGLPRLWKLGPPQSSGQRHAHCEGRRGAGATMSSGPGSQESGPWSLPFGTCPPLWPSQACARTCEPHGPHAKPGIPCPWPDGGHESKTWPRPQRAHSLPRVPSFWGTQALCEPPEKCPYAHKHKFYLFILGAVSPTKAPQGASYRARGRLQHRAQR